MVLWQDLRHKVNYVICITWACMIWARDTPARITLGIRLCKIESEITTHGVIERSLTSMEDAQCCS
jgi:hypothetical protein